MVSHNVVTDSRQLVTQSLCSNTGIGLRGLPSIVPLEPFDIPATQMGSFDKCPRQIAIPVLTVAFALDLASG